MSGSAESGAAWRATGGATGVPSGGRSAIDQPDVGHQQVGQPAGVRGVLVAVLEPETSIAVPAAGTADGLSEPLSPEATLGVEARRLVSVARRLAAKAGWNSRVVSWRATQGDDAASSAGALGTATSSGTASPAGERLDAASIATALAEHLAASATVAGETGRPLVVLLADTVQGREVAVLLAHRLDCGVVLGCSDVRLEGGRATSDPLFVKPVYGGWLERECRLAGGGPLVVTWDLTGLEEAEGKLPGEVQMVEVIPGAEGDLETSAEPGLIRWLESIPPDPRTVDLVHAKRVIAVGAGAATESLLAAARELADLLGGSLGATRPVVDEGWFSKDRLIGQTGKTVGPDLYLALGISGSPHHVAGVQKAGRIVSVNRDPRAPIFGLGDLGFVADLEAVLPALVERIKAWRDEREAALGREEGDGPV